MATQSRRATQGASSDADESGAALPAATTLAEMSRQQMAAAAEAMSVMFSAAQALQQAQMHMGERAALLHRQAAENIRKATTPVELMSIQSTLLVYEFQEAMRYWQELMAASAKAGGQMMRPGQAGEADGAGATSSAATMMGAAMNAAAPMADAFQQMFTAPLKAAAAQQPH
jgi:hypothetical protein